MGNKIIAIMLTALACSSTAAAQVSLDSCRSMALRNNKEMRQARIKVEAAGYQRKEAKAAYLPSFDFEASYIYNQKKLSLVESDQMLPTKSFNPATGTYEYNLVKDATGAPVIVNGSVVPSTVALLPKSALTYNVHNVAFGAITITQPIYMGGKIKAMNEITKYAEELARIAQDSKAQDVVYGVDEAYWQVVSLKAKQKLAKSYVELVESFDSDVQKLIAQGVATKASKLTVDVRLNEANVALTKVDNGLALSRMHLAQLCGQPINSNFTLADEDRDTWSTTSAGVAPVDINSVYARRNEVRSLELAGKIYDQKVKVARSEMLPQLAAFGAYHAMNPNSYDGFKNKFGFAFSVGAMVKIPLWHWGGLSSKVKAAECEARLKREELDDAKSKIELQVQQANYRYQESLKTLEMTRTNMKKAEENLRVAQLAFKEGMGTTDDVLTAQTAWLQANSERIDAEIDVQLCDVYLSKVLGTMKY